MNTTGGAVRDTPTNTDGGFAARLRHETQPAHGLAERDGALAVLINGAGDLALYRALLTQLQFVYAALETAAEQMRADPVSGPFAVPELTRLPALHADLEVVAGQGWTASARALPQTQRYVDRLHEVASASSATFVAHHYTRYLGDLSGGLAVGAAAKRHLGLVDAGRSFFVFDAIASPKRFKDRYRQLLDDAPWSPAERNLLIAETLRAYALNTELQLAVVDQVSSDRTESERMA